MTLEYGGSLYSSKSDLAEGIIEAEFTLISDITDELSRNSNEDIVNDCIQYRGLDEGWLESRGLTKEDLLAGAARYRERKLKEMQG